MQTHYLDTSHQHFGDGNTIHALQVLIQGLRLTRQELSASSWREYVERSRGHPMLQMMQRCPFTNHAASRPRGYPGDAKLIDFIYGYEKPMLEGTAKRIYGANIASPAPRAVRYRRGVLASLIDRTLHEYGEDSSVLAAACGHLRELDLSTAIHHLRPARFIALDQDEESLAEVERKCSHLGVTPVKRNIRDLIVGKVRYEGLHLAYAAGLYDYLSDEVAEKLTLNLFSMLTSGGRLLIANFLPDIRDVGYMEVAMDWWLVYRDDAAMLRLISQIPERCLESVRQFKDPDENITFLELRKR